MTNKSYFTAIKNKVDETIKELQALDAKKIANDKLITSGVYKDDYVEELRAENREIKHAKDNGITRAESEIQKMCDSYVQELRMSEGLDGSELTDDVKLLNCGVKMSDKDLMGILARNKGNKTMEQIVSRYANENNIKIDFVYTSESMQSIRIVEQAPYVAKVVMKNYSDSSVYDRLLGENSDMYKAYNA